MLYGNAGGDLNNNLLIVPSSDFTLSPGIKFGGGKIRVTVDDEQIKVLMTEYRIPHVYKKYAVEILVPEGRMVDELRLNGEKMQAKINNRGFVTISSSWKQGDEITVKLR